MANSMEIRMEIQGLDQAIKKLKLYDSKSRKKIEAAISKAGRNIRDGAKTRVPVRTGTLRDSIGARFNGGKMQSVVKADYGKAPHAHLIEFGVRQTVIVPKKKQVLKFSVGGETVYTKKSITLPARKARPFMNPAFQAEKPKIEAEIEKIIKEMP